MPYRNTLFVLVTLILLGIFLYLFYRSWFEKESILVLSGKRKKIRFPRFEDLKKYFIILSVILIGITAFNDTRFLTVNRCSNDQRNRSTQQWEGKLGKNPAYDMCFCAQGYPVFKDPSRAFTQMLLDNPIGVWKMSLYYFLPLTRTTYKTFMTYYNATGYPTNDPVLINQFDRIKIFLDLFDNNYNKYLVPIDADGNQTTMNGILDLTITEFKELDYVYLSNGEKKESEVGYTYLYVYYYLKNLLKTPYNVSGDSITIRDTQEELPLVSTMDINKIDKNITGEIDSNSVRAGLIIVKVKLDATFTLEYLDKGIANYAFIFSIN